MSNYEFTKLVKKKPTEISAWKENKAWTSGVWQIINPRIPA